ncbi:MAG: PPK2 family polyphosphate:nucleotide phosphotransferase [Akkermansiaceae bacterium]|jgi:PPK2 family polyphosphate:nucleotide phosphotransferase
MLGEKFTKHCMVKPGETVRLDDLETTTLGILDQPEEEATPIFQELRSKLANQQRVLYAEGKKKLLIVMQAMDTGGKDGCVRKIFSRVDPQGMRVTPFKAPSERELAHDFLWRVHQVVPAKGEIAVFNRSHYEDIIAVRVKNLAPEEVWEKRYQHIINFEQMLVDEGTTILKIFLNISKDEQKRRLQSRLDRPEKHWKFFPEDLADRARWDDFKEAYEDVFTRTSTKNAPWFIIPADHKWYRDMAVSQIVTHALEGMDLEYPKVTWDPSEIVVK